MTVYFRELNEIIESLENNYKRNTLENEGVAYFKERLEKYKDRKINRGVLDTINGHKMIPYEKDENNKVYLSINDEYFGKELHISIYCNRRYDTDWAHTIKIDDSMTTWKDVLDKWDEIDKQVNKVESPDVDTITKDYEQALVKKNELNEIMEDFYKKHQTILQR